MQFKSWLLACALMSAGTIAQAAPITIQVDGVLASESFYGFGQFRPSQMDFDPTGILDTTSCFDDAGETFCHISALDVMELRKHTTVEPAQLPQTFSATITFDDTLESYGFVNTGALDPSYPDSVCSGPALFCNFTNFGAYVGLTKVGFDGSALSVDTVGVDTWHALRPTRYSLSFISYDISAPGLWMINGSGGLSVQYDITQTILTRVAPVPLPASALPLIIALLSLPLTRAFKGKRADG